MLIYVAVPANYRPAHPTPLLPVERGTDRDFLKFKAAHPGAVYLLVDTDAENNGMKLVRQQLSVLVGAGWKQIERQIENELARVHIEKVAQSRREYADRVARDRAAQVEAF